MIKKSIDYLNLQQIADSGQCFRWKKQDDNKYSVIAYGKYVEIEQNGNEFTFSCDEQEWEQVWSKYFDMETDYGQIATMIMESGDEHLIEAYKYGSGVRILRQDLWEMIVSFMISHTLNIFSKGKIKAMLFRPIYLYIMIAIILLQWFVKLFLAIRYQIYVLD